ncbi:hemagglutinin repeat-containing protein, partial [Xenophilus sp.]|uniref:hemagglutinin repeat-containing protein n=1 Tax=Xenophilus sp. TaxID=1873499 RepID=UPI0037DD0726
LVPQVYVRVRPGDIDGHGALLSAGKFQFDDKAANLVNTGTIAGRELVSINAAAVDNLGGRISGGKVGIQAQVDINNLGGTIDARDKLSLTAGRDVNVRTTTGAGALGNVGIDRVAGLYVSGPGGALSVDAGRDANLIGAQVVNAGSGATAIKAGNDVNLGTVTTTEASVAFGSNMSGSFIHSTEVGTAVSGGGSVRLDAGRDVNARAAGVAAEGDLNVDAGRDIRIEAGRERTNFSYSAHWSSSNALRRKDTTVDAQAHSDNAIGSSFTGKNVTLDADRDIGISGSYVSAQDKLGLDAGRDVNIGVATNSSSTSMSTATQRTPTGLARAMSVPGVMVTIETSIPEPVAGTLLTNKGVRDNAMTQDVTVTGSLLTGASVDIKSGRDTTIAGSQIIADHDVSVAAGNNLTVQSAQEAHVQGQGSVVHASGKTNSAGMPAFGVASGMSQTASSPVHQVGSQIVSLDGNVALSSGATYTQTASDVLALGIGADGKAGNIGIRAKNVVIQSADDTQLTVNLSRESHATFGGTANLGIVNTVKSVQALAEASQRTNDSRAQALAAASTAVTIGQAISSGGFGSASIGVTQSKGHSHSQSAQVQSVPVGSTISAAGNVSITATGAGAGSNISVVGSAIEGENVSLTADNDVTLASAVGSSNSISSSQSSQMSAGAALSVGSQTGLVFQGGAGKSSGGGTGLAVAHYNTTVTGAQSVSIASGGDTTMHGAVVTGEKVTASVGGDLSITSPQDVSISTA